MPLFLTAHAQSVLRLCREDTESVFCLPREDTVRNKSSNPYPEDVSMYSVICDANKIRFTFSARSQTIVPHCSVVYLYIAYVSCIVYTAMACVVSAKECLHKDCLLNTNLI